MRDSIIPATSRLIRRKDTLSDASDGSSSNKSIQQHRRATSDTV